ncbi:ubiE/COQ5 methyltransferase family [Seminavis robusta]|uniref:UbiE/COQ5 methyltransferase family n=1 Tax=Seminavis robusta TaxID=568900 RepID=A0A9N8I159_9STRA|nr:ubiE/COQ5 methyltransferase family [Seminavis robusta]|eukprot:Sro3158_g344620.1 ubiE/COQ5 methyltransferase family (167) ;mRNA; r:8159-8659
MKRKVQLQVADAADTGLASDSVDIVQILFVLHELPLDVAVQVMAEAHRILKPNGGQLWMGEMDFSAPAYAAQRNNPLLFSLLRATEPHLDEYADGFATTIQPALHGLFDKVVWTAATGRHYTVVATKNTNNNQKAVIEDYRFLPNGDYAIADTHLQLWESETTTEE